MLLMSLSKTEPKIPGRPVFGEMLDRMEKVKPLVFWRGIPDRLAHQLGRWRKIIYLVDTGVISEMKFPTFSLIRHRKESSCFQSLFSQSKYYVDNLSENIKRGHRNKSEKVYGLKCRRWVT